MAEDLNQQGAGAPPPQDSGGGGAPESIDFPSSWRAEDRQHWEAAPEDVRKIIAAREQNWQKESEKYKAAHENWSRFHPVIQRFDKLFQEEGVAPDQGIANVLQLAHNLRYGDDEIRGRVLETLQNIYAPKKKKEFIDPDVGEVHNELTQRLAQLEQGLNSLNQGFRGYIEEGTRREIESFGKDPAHKHLDKLSNMMAKMMNGGLATDMEHAYSMALKLHPDLVDKAEAEQSRNQSDIKKAQSRQALQAAGINVRGNGRAPEGSKPQPSLRKSLEKVYDKVNSRQT